MLDPVNLGALGWRHWPRRFGRVPQAPTREVVAGCAIATCCAASSSSVARCFHRRVAPISPGHTKGGLVAAGRTLHTKEAQKHLHVRFADKKTAIVSSHRTLALRVAHHLGLQAEAVKTKTVVLGVDASAGKARAVTTLKRRKRLRSPFKRKGQTASASEKNGPRNAEDLQVWPASSGMYGDEVSGVSDGEWRGVQRLASEAHSPLTAGRSLYAVWLGTRTRGLWCSSTTSALPC